MRNRLDRNKGGGDREQQSSSSPSVNASKDTVAQTSSGIFTKTRAIQFVVLIWVTRLSFLAISYGLPTIIVIFQEISRKIAGSSPQSVVEVAWTDDMKEFLSADSEDFPKVGIYIYMKEREREIVFTMKASFICPHSCIY